MLAVSVSAQFNVAAAPENKPTSTATSMDSLNANQQKLTIQYDSETQRKAQRKALIKQRNYFEFTGQFQAILNAYSENWTKGGENNLSLNTNFLIKHTYKKDRFTLDSRIEAAYAQNYINDDPNAEWLKTQDYFFIRTNPAWAISKEGAGRYWSYSAEASLRSQFDRGYKNRAEKRVDWNNKNFAKLQSNFMSPATLNVSVGIKYTSPNARFPFKININPLSCQTVFVKDGNLRTYTYDTVAKKNTYNRNPYGMPQKKNHRLHQGVNYYSPLRFEGGSSIGIDFDTYFDKKKIIRYNTSVNCFYGWISDLAANKEGDYQHILPTFRWNNTFDIKVIKYLSLTFKINMYYDRKEVDALQLQYYTSVGLSYTFKSK